jgi:DNA-binding response OmpR family regulator
MARILIVEDDPNIRKLLSVNLVARGHEVIEAEDGQGGLARLRDSSPTILLLDIRLPDMLGWEVLKIMTDDPTYNPVPVIVITASMGSVNPDYAISENRYLHIILKKPINIQELTQEVKEVLN